MIIHSIKNLSNPVLVKLLKENLSAVTDVNSLKNYHPDYSNLPGNLFYILNEGRYADGNYYIIEQDGEYLGSAGWNPYDDVALVLTRAYIPEKYRRQYFMAEHLLPLILEETTDYNKLWITCNKYNIAIYHGLGRLSSGKSTSFFSTWPPIYKNFVPIGKKIIYHTEQYVAEYIRS
jgi:hypothetical protein